VTTQLQTGRLAAVAACLVSLAGFVSCGEVVRQGRSPAYLVIDSLMASSGAQPKEFGHFLQSDVVTNVKVQTPAGEVYVPTVFEDVGRVQISLALKDLGTPGNPNSPSTNNSITLNRYRVVFKRADGRNTPGVDVPYAFDGALTGTVTSSPLTVAFVLVRAQAKLEAPLRSLREMGGGIILSTIAEVTLYGRDQTGNDTNVSGSISVNFADWGDPPSAGN
jgi:hypothetical protein